MYSSTRKVLLSFLFFFFFFFYVEEMGTPVGDAGVHVVTLVVLLSLSHHAKSTFEVTPLSTAFKMAMMVPRTVSAIPKNSSKEALILFADSHGSVEARR